MTLDFYQKEIEKEEGWSGEPYVGYFAPNGKLIHYNILFGGRHHDDWRNPVSLAFLKYISFISDDYTMDGFFAKYLKEHNPEKLDMMSIEGNPNLEDILIFMVLDLLIMKNYLKN